MALDIADEGVMILDPLERGAALFSEESMGYKYKPNKSVAKRFKVSKTGKLKRHHCFTSHLMSARPANKRRKLRRPVH